MESADVGTERVHRNQPGHVVGKAQTDKVRKSSAKTGQAVAMGGWHHNDVGRFAELVPQFIGDRLIALDAKRVGADRGSRKSGYRHPVERLDRCLHDRPPVRAVVVRDHAGAVGLHENAHLAWHRRDGEHDAAKPSGGSIGGDCCAVVARR